MKASRLKLLVLLAALVSVPAFAAAPLVGLLASLNLHLAAGALVAYFARDVKINNTPTRMYIQLEPVAKTPDTELPTAPGAPSQSIPASVNVAPTGGTVTLTVPAHTANSTNYPGLTVTVPAMSLATTLRSLDPSKVYPGYYPSHITGLDTSAVVTASRLYRSTTSGDTVYKSQPYTPSPSTLTGYAGHYVKLDIKTSSSAYSLSFPVDGGTFEACPAGYSPSANLTTCTLTDAEAAKANPATSRDYKCVITRSGPNPFDPDCAAARTAGALTAEAAQSGRQVWLVRDPSGASPEVTAVSARPAATNSSDDPGGVDVSQSLTSPDGSASRQDVSTYDNPAGGTPRVGDVSGANYPANPPPLYPGQVSPSGGSGSSTSTGGGAGATCGGAGQPACAVKADPGFWDGLLDKLGAGSGSSSLPDLTKDAECSDCDNNVRNKESFYDSVMGFSNITIDVPAVSCTQAFSAFDTTVSFFDTTVDLEMTPVCDLLSMHEALLRALFLLGWSLLGVFIILEKIE